MVWNKLKEVFSVDLRSLAIFRMGLAVVLLGDLLIRATDLRFFYTDAGVLPRASLLAKPTAPWFISVHLVNGTLAFQAALFFITAVAGLGLLVGYRTRFMTCLCWFLTSSLHARNFLVLQGGDDYLRVSLFWSMFVPLNAYFSIDKKLNTGSEKIPPQWIGWGSFALIMQTVLLYLSTATFKSRGTSWWDGTALYYALNLDCFAKPLAFYLLLMPDLLKIMTRFVFAFEFAGGLLLISPLWNGPLRTLAVFGFIFFHLGIFLSMAIGPFQWISMVAVTALFPTWFLDRITKIQDSPPMLKLGWTADWLMKSRTGLCRVLQRLPRRPLSVRPSPWSAPFILFFFGCVVWWDLSALNPKTFLLPPAVTAICYTVNLKQGWAMFSPNVTKSSGWFVIPGKLTDGTIIDLNRGGAPLSWAAPPLISAYYKNERRRKFLMNMRSSRVLRYRSDFSRSLCQSWNQTHQGGQALQSLEVIFVDRHILPDDRATNYQRKVLWHAYCSTEARSFGPPLPWLAPEFTPANSNGDAEPSRER